MSILRSQSFFFFIFSSFARTVKRHFRARVRRLRLLLPTPTFFKLSPLKEVDHHYVGHIVVTNDGARAHKNSSEEVFNSL